MVIILLLNTCVFHGRENREFIGRNYRPDANVLFIDIRARKKSDPPAMQQNPGV